MAALLISIQPHFLACSVRMALTHPLLSQPTVELPTSMFVLT